MTSLKPTQVFASLSSQTNHVPFKKETERVSKASSQAKGNHIQVNAVGEVCQPPDRCRVFIAVSSSKDQVQDVKNSVARRLDYIIQTLQNQQIKEGDIQVTKVLRRDGTLYHLQADVTVHFTDFNRCQSVCNLLVEKLDDSVKVSLPEFYHSANKQENLRRKASMIAAQNAKSKASELAQFLSASVGALFLLEEVESFEWEGPAEGGSGLNLNLTSVQQRLAQATLHVSVKVLASFELKNKSKEKHAKD